MDNFNVAPDSLLEFALVTVSLIVVIYAFYQAIRCTFWPGEESPDHIKRRILKLDIDEES